MKTISALAAMTLALAVASTAASAQTNVRTTYMKDDPAVCRKSLQTPGAEGSAAMATLPQTVLLYNFRHVTGPNPVLVTRRALGALRCYSDLDDSGYMIGLRGAFEAMGGTVSISHDNRKIDVEKAGVSIKLVVGQPVITIDGESRPLDAPPIVHRGIIYVPIRVISESLGGYVVWDGESREVIIRYVPASIPTPPATPLSGAPTPAPPEATPTPATVPTPAPTATPNPAKTAALEHFVAGDYTFATKTYDAFNPGNSGGGSSFGARAAIELALGSVPVMLGGDYRSLAYPHDAASGDFAYPKSGLPQYVPCPADGYAGCVLTPGRTASVFVPATDLRYTTIAGNVGIAVLSHTYIAGSFASVQNNYPASYPSIPSLDGFGFGVDRLPDLNRPLSLYGSAYYYPTLGGDYDVPALLPAPAAASGKMQESLLKYQVGASVKLGTSPLFLDLGYLGDSVKAKNLSPSDASHDGGYAGLGLKF